ncbi:bacteriocin immunity protein [Pectobacterium polaris]|nr:bacteriocin immunity protein [Pectobacterium polaris]
MNLISEICDANGDDEYQDSLFDNLTKITEYPSVSDVIYYPADGDDDSPLLWLHS